MRQISVLFVETVTGISAFAVNYKVITGSKVPSSFNVIDCCTASTVGYIFVKIRY